MAEVVVGTKRTREFHEVGQQGGDGSLEKGEEVEHTDITTSTTSPDTLCNNLLEQARKFDQVGSEGGLKQDTQGANLREPDSKKKKMSQCSELEDVNSTTAERSLKASQEKPIDTQEKRDPQTGKPADRERERDRERDRGDRDRDRDRERDRYHDKNGHRPKEKRDFDRRDRAYDEVRRYPSPERRSPPRGDKPFGR
jgi:hypothetical protein